MYIRYMHEFDIFAYVCICVCTHIYLYLYICSYAKHPFDFHINFSIHLSVSSNKASIRIVSKKYTNLGSISTLTYFFQSVNIKYLFIF